MLPYSFYSLKYDPKSQPSAAIKTLTHRNTFITAITHIEKLLKQMFVITTEAF